MIKELLQKIGRKNIIIFVSIILFSAISTFVVLQKMGTGKMVGGVNTTPDNTTQQQEQSWATTEPSKSPATSPSKEKTDSNANYSNAETNSDQNTPNNNQNSSTTATNQPTSAPTSNGNTPTPTSTPTNTPQPTNTPSQNDNVSVSFKIYWERNKPVYDYYVTVCLGDLDVA